MERNWNTCVDKGALIARYADWLDLIPHLVGRFKIQWPTEEIWTHVEDDKIHVRWRLGHLGRIYLDGDNICFSSNARLDLKQLEAGVPGLEFHEQLQPLIGWQTDEGRKSDIEYVLGYFWSTAFEEAQLYWNTRQLADTKLDEIR